MKFDSVSQRSILRPIINDKYVEMFSNYDNDLNKAQSNFERFKNNPPLLRNAPPVAGAISWVRQLMKNIQEPMKLFESSKYIANLEDFSRITKKFNHLNALFSVYESTFLNQWKSSIDSAKQGMNQHLLIQEPETKQLIINADDRLAQLFHEAKWLKRMGIDIPQVAHELIGKEKKFKQYRSHLEMLFSEYEKVYKSIPDNLQALFEPHVKLTLDVCNPGCFILTWNSLNIGK
jgi:dynein heavy chain, axonemal